MKNLLLFLFVVLLTQMVFGQSFEGKITYANTYKSKNPQMPDMQLAMMMGTTHKYFIKNGNYKMEMNGLMIKWLLYVNDDNKLYSKMANSEAVLWSDGAVNKKIIVDSKINKGVLDILGYKCDELVLTCKKGVEKYYFNAALKVDASLFKSHKYGNWYAFLEKSNAMPLKIVLDNEEIYMESIATDVKKTSLDASYFKLPKDTQTVQSPY